SLALFSLHSSIDYYYSYNMECCKSPWLVFAILCIIQLRAFAQLPSGNAAPATGVKVTSDNAHVTIDNGLMQLILSNPTGHVCAIQYHGEKNLLDTHEPKLYGGYFDVAFQLLPSKDGKVEIVTGTDYKVITEKEDVVEVSFSRTWSPGQPNTVVPLNVDMRYIVRKGVPGFYIYVIVERLKGWPDVDMNYHRYAFKPNKTLFNYMAITDEIQLVMPTEADRQAGKPLAYKEAVKLTNPVSNPAFKDQVDDKYEYTLEKTELKLKGWVSDSAKIGFWVIAPSDEYMNGGPKKNDLTCHCGPTVVVIFTSIHTFGLDLLTEYRNGEPWKKAFGPILVYLNSDADHSALWKDAKSQLDKEIQQWPYTFVQHQDYLQAAQRGTVTGQLMVDDKYLNPSPKEAANAFVGLCMPGTTDDAWQYEIKGYNFWTQTDDKGNFVIKNVRPGDYNLYGYVIGVVSSFRHPQLITVKAGDELKLGQVSFKPPRTGPTVWEIGIPDRSANEFFVPDADPNFVNKFWLDKPKDKYRQYGLWLQYPVVYPKDDVVFEVGVSNYSKDWFFAHVLRAAGNTYNPTIWRVVFDLPEVSPTGNYTIQIALAAAEMTNTYV
ncbi:Rhamnogalacturonate lyase, partial [Linum perenne]